MPIAVSCASSSSCAHKTLVVTGTHYGASTANQHIHGFGGSREGSPEWYPACFRFDPTLEARAWCVVLSTCSTKAAFVG